MAFKLDASPFQSPVKPNLRSILGGNLLVSNKAIIIASSLGFLILTAVFGACLSLGLMKASYGQSCSTTKPCLTIENTICDLEQNTSSNYVCKCDALKYWSTDKCLNRVSINETCMSTTNCLEEKNLECINSTCSCDPLKVIWSSSSDKCELKKSYNETCILSGECNDNVNLLCSSSVCTCNLTQFWNGNSCENKRLFNETCLSTDWCNTQVNKLSCVQQAWSMESNVGFCKCNSSQYYNTFSSSCVALLLYAQNGCTSNSECNYNFNLSCVSGVCTCATSEYYDGTKCLTKVTYGSSCHFLIYNGSLYPKCLDTLGLTCQSSKCTCNSTQFWSTIQTKCLNKLSIGSQCSASTDCDTTKNLLCTSGFCQCMSTFYYASTGCAYKLSHNSSCSSNTECNNNSLLTCSSARCSCVTAPFIYWSSTWLTCLKMPTNILKAVEIEYLFTMTGLASTHQPTLLYRASRDGQTASAFHAKCDGFANTLTIIRNTNNYVFGGYASTTWDSYSDCKSDANAFIFNLRKNFVSNYVKIPIAITSCGIRGISGYGPIFGYDDILVDYRAYSNFDGKCTYCNAYTCPSGMTSGFTSYNYLCGGSTSGFYFSDVEVFAV